MLSEGRDRPGTLTGRSTRADKHPPTHHNTMRQLQLRFAPTYADYISVISARFSSVASQTENKHGKALPGWAKWLLKPVTLSWATYGFFTKKRRIGELKLTIDDNGITILTRNTNQHTAWSNIVGVEQHETGYILLGRRGYGVLIPKRVMNDGEHATLASIIAARHVPGAPGAA